MITEDYVSFETAKLLKEKGFDSECDYLYVNGNIVRAQGGKCNWNKGETIFTDYKNECSAPTLQMVMKWLREVHNLFVFPFPQMNTNKFWVEIYQLSDNQEWISLYCESIDLKDYPFYEQACEAAIQYCLQNLI